MTTPTFTLSPQQTNVLNFIEHGKGNAVLIAVAGAGKTSILIEGSSRMYGEVAYAVYNTRNKIEIEPKIAARGLANKVKVRTFHSFGFAAWAKAHPKPDVQKNKIRDLVRNYRHPNPDPDGDFIPVPRDLYPFVEELVSLVRQSGAGIITDLFDKDLWNGLVDHHDLEDKLEDKKPWEESTLTAEELRSLRVSGMNWAVKVLRASIKMAREQNIIDFDDQIFMPLLDKCRVWQYDWVLVDEAQDTNPTRLAMAAAMLKPNGRLLAVGDPAQAIYGFTGADSDSLENIKKRFNAIELPLTVSFRCPSQVVTHARQWVSHIESAPNAPTGLVEWINQDSLLDTVRGSNLEQSVILCRKNAPLVDIAFDFIRNGIPCHVLGRDIGAGIKTLAQRWKVEFLTDLLEKVQDYRETQVRKLTEKGQDAKAESITDRCDTLKALATGILREDAQATVSDLLDRVDSLFGENNDGGLTLSSIHKSKGLEWRTVYWLGRAAFQPSPFAKQDWQLEQERNLCYVAATRSQDQLIEVIVPTKAKEY